MHNPILINWLNNIYSLEIESLRMLESHKGDAVTHPEITAHIQIYSQLCTYHAVRARQLLEKGGRRVSTFRATFANIIGKIKGMSTELNNDKVARNAMDEFTHSYTKKAAYSALLAGAKETADEEVVKLCKEALHEEQDYIDWLNVYLPQLAREVTLRYNTRVIKKKPLLHIRIKNFTPLNIRTFNSALNFRV